MKNLTSWTNERLTLFWKRKVFHWGRWKEPPTHSPYLLSYLVCRSENSHLYEKCYILAHHIYDIRTNISNQSLFTGDLSLLLSHFLFISFFFSLLKFISVKRPSSLIFFFFFYPILSFLFVLQFFIHHPLSWWTDNSKIYMSLSISFLW